MNEFNIAMTVCRISKQGHAGHTPNSEYRIVSSYLTCIPITGQGTNVISVWICVAETFCKYRIKVDVM